MKISVEHYRCVSDDQNLYDKASIRKLGLVMLGRGGLTIVRVGPHVGVATCARHQHYNKAKGRDLAIRRALEQLNGHCNDSEGC